jgi:hypothetical protein
MTNALHFLLWDLWIVHFSISVLRTDELTNNFRRPMAGSRVIRPSGFFSLHLSLFFIYLSSSSISLLHLSLSFSISRSLSLSFSISRSLSLSFSISLLHLSLFFIYLSSSSISLLHLSLFFFFSISRSFGSFGSFDLTVT